MLEHATRDLARFGAGLKYEHLPAEVVERISRGQSYIDRHHSAEAVARFDLGVQFGWDGEETTLPGVCIAEVKQSLGDWAATTATGDSPLRPNIACSRSACSVLVGRPVDGPPRWMSITTSGSSVETARPMRSLP